MHRVTNSIIAQLAGIIVTRHLGSSANLKVPYGNIDTTTTPSMTNRGSGDPGGQTIPSGSTTAVANTSQTITTKGGRVVAFFSANRVTLSGGTGQFFLYVDGASKGEISRSNNDFATSGLITVTGLTAGSHTFDVRGNNSGGNIVMATFSFVQLSIFEVI